MIKIIIKEITDGVYVNDCHYNYDINGMGSCNGSIIDSRNYIILDKNKEEFKGIIYYLEIENKNERNNSGSNEEADISKELKLSLSEYQDILKKCGARKMFWDHVRKHWDKKLYFKSRADVERVIEKLESRLILVTLIE